MAYNITIGETLELEVVRRKENSPYEYSNVSIGTFKGKVAGTKETKSYHITSGVNGNIGSMFLICSNLPTDIKVGDIVKVMGESKVVNSVGYYCEKTNIINNSLFSNEYLIAKCPKGLNIG